MMNDDDDRKNKKEKSILDMLREKREREALEQGKDPNVIELKVIPGTDGDLPLDHPKNKAAIDAFEQNEQEEKPGEQDGVADFWICLMARSRIFMTFLECWKTRCNMKPTVSVTKGTCRKFCFRSRPSIKF